jgi:serine/threonine protein kinase
MTTEEFDDEAFGDLLKRIARTPDVSALCREVRPGTELLGRFVVGRQLGAGGMGRVFAAFDRQRQTNVALKMLGVLTPQSIVALRREFRCVAELAHPNLVRLYELFSDDEEWFFSMELLEGRTLS